MKTYLRTVFCANKDPIILKKIGDPLFNILGAIFLLIGVIGIFLPLLPTTPFLLLAAYFFSKGSQKIYLWLINLPRIGTSIQDWNESGSISKKTKCSAVLCITLTAFYIWFGLKISVIARILAILTLLSVVVFITTRPEKK